MEICFCESRGLKKASKRLSQPSEIADSSAKSEGERSQAQALTTCPEAASRFERFRSGCSAESQRLEDCQAVPSVACPPSASARAAAGSCRPYPLQRSGASPQRPTMHRTDPRPASAPGTLARPTCDGSRGSLRGGAAPPAEAASSSGKFEYERAQSCRTAHAAEGQERRGEGEEGGGFRAPAAARPFWRHSSLSLSFRLSATTAPPPPTSITIYEYSAST
eukprot:scaffold208650_cov27-Tisochrysis_lutea.AAC.3